MLEDQQPLEERRQPQGEEGQERSWERLTRRQVLPFGLIKILCRGPQESSSGASPQSKPSNSLHKRSLSKLINVTPSKYLAKFNQAIKGVAGPMQPYHLCWPKPGCRASLLLIRDQVSDRDFKFYSHLVLGQFFLVSGLLS